MGWWDYFCERQKQCGLPFVLDSPLKTLASGLAIIKAFTDFAKDIGMKQMTQMSLGAFARAMLNRKAYDAAVRETLKKLAEQGLKATARPLGAQVGTASGAVTTAGAILASAYIGVLIGCAIYATDKCLGGALDEEVSKASEGFWYWWYGGYAQDRLNEQMQAKLMLMRQLKNEAFILGIKPSELADRVARGDYVPLSSGWAVI